MLSLGAGGEGRVWPGQSSSCVAAAAADAAAAVGCAFWQFWGQFRETTFFSPTGSRKFARRRAGNGSTQNFAARLVEVVKLYFCTIRCLKIGKTNKQEEQKTLKEGPGPGPGPAQSPFIALSRIGFTKIASITALEIILMHWP